MGVFLAILIIELAVVSACGHRLIRYVQDGLQLLVYIKRIVGGLGYAHFPWQALFTNAACDDFSANFNHKVLNAFAF